MRRLMMLFVVFLLVACSPGPVHPDPSILPVELGKSATVALVAGPEFTTPYCSGVWISHTIMLTAMHCAREAAKIEIIMQANPGIRGLLVELLPPPENPLGAGVMYVVEAEFKYGSKLPVHRGKVVAMDRKHDLAMIKADMVSIPAHASLSIAKKLPPLGSQVLVVGHPMGLYFTVMNGMLAAIRPQFPYDADEEDHPVEGPVIQIYSGIYHGVSGGPVVSSHGELVGICSFIARSPNQGFAVPAESIEKFVAENSKQML